MFLCMYHCKKGCYAILYNTVYGDVIYTVLHTTSPYTVLHSDTQMLFNVIQAYDPLLHSVHVHVCTTCGVEREKLMWFCASVCSTCTCEKYLQLRRVSYTVQ